MPDDVPFELYNLETDPGESQNLIESHPEEKERLMKAYETWFEDVSTARKDNYAKPAIIIGSENETITELTAQDWTKLSGKGWGDSGSWKLEVSAASIFDIEVQLPNAEESAIANLDLNGESFSKAFPGGQTHVRFENVELDPGSLTLTGSVSAKDALLPSFHVLLTKK